MFVKGHLRMSSRGPLTLSLSTHSLHTAVSSTCPKHSQDYPKGEVQTQTPARFSRAHATPTNPNHSSQVLLSWRPSWLLQLRARTMTQLQAWSLRSRQQLGALRRCSSRP